MKCTKCNSEVAGDFCTNCGIEIHDKKRKLLGFRSNKTWKKIISVVHLVFCLLMLLYTVTTERQGQITTYDFWINKAFEIVLCCSFISPFLFLSNTKLREKMPFFKKHTKGASFCGMIIVLFGLMIVVGIINSMHSYEYKTDMTNHAYTVVSTTEASCTEDGEISYICEYCGRSKQEILPISEHTWKSADCKTPKTCQLCGLTEGEKIEHQWIEATCTIPKKCEICGCVEGVVKDHVWVEATCSTPKKCEICGHVEGEVKDHTWLSATCVLPQKCLYCGIEFGEALSIERVHTWKESTCTNPKICTVCGVEEGIAKGHIQGEWEVIEEGTIDLQGTRQRKCIECGTVILTERFDSIFKIVSIVLNDAVKKHSSRIEDLEIVMGEDSSTLIVMGIVFGENSEKTATNILTEISSALQRVENDVECIFTYGDIKQGNESECLAICSVDKDGKCVISPASVNFKTERNEWIKKQFSVWDGSHMVLNNLIKENLNDEDSFKHINTTYIDVSSDEIKEDVNGILKESGYSQRVEKGDLLIITEFSAKNAFNATLKNTACAIVDYSQDLVILVGIE